MNSLETIGWLALYYANTLALFTVLAACARGKDAIRWPKNVIKSATANMCMLAVNMTIAPVIYAMATLAQAGYDHLALPHVASEAWADVPVWVMVITAILIRDFADYWNHRLLHYGVFWPIHSVHHSDPDLNNSTAFRIHFFESLMMDLSYVLIASWAGLPPGITAGVSLLLVLYNRYIHMTVDWGHGPLRYVFASPRFHQWHHADDPSSYNTNFANIFVGWDLLFGTYRVLGPCRERFGIPGMPKHNVLKLVIWPFTEWAKMCRQALPVSKKREQNVSSGELTSRPS
jgi:sterol desaturase/sphingolipid hydroxylase (fatty acid hydroxylase superfamily)